MLKPTFICSIILLAFSLSGCESTYYSAMEQVGIHKRDILIDRIEDAREAQQDGQEQFKSALEQFKSVVDFDGGELETVYNQLNDEYENSVDAAEEISDHINQVDSVAEALFDEWEQELDQYTNATFRRDSERQLKLTRQRYAQLLKTMRRAEKSIDPVLDTLRDNTLYLKHNLNARAIASLKAEFSTVNNNISTLINAMENAINESDAFIEQLKQG